MKNQCGSDSAPNTPLRLRLSFLLAVASLLIMTVIFSACTSQSIGTTDVPGVSTTGSNEGVQLGAGNQQNNQYPVKVYFSKVNATNFGDVVAVNRTSPTLAVGTFAVEQAVAGPTSAEKSQGLFSQLHDSINGASNCTGQNATGGSDFLLTLNKKGTVNEQGTATIQFCRDINSPGVGSDARIQFEVSTTLKQFSSIKKVVILLKSGHCLGDESGMDMCLK
jgi:hypothetical protein